MTAIEQDVSIKNFDISKNHNFSSHIPEFSDKLNTFENANFFNFEEYEHNNEQKPYPKYPVGFIVDVETKSQIVNTYKTTDLALLNLIGHHLFGNWKDGDYSVVSIHLMELLTGTKHSKHRLISKWLDRLSMVTDIDVNASIPKIRATSFKINNIPEDLRYAKNKIIDNPVLLSDGNLREYVGKIYEAKRNYSRDCSTKYPNPVSKHLINYLNNLSTNSFTSRINNNWQSIKTSIEGLDDDAKNEAIRSINHIRVCPLPIYKQVENSSRIYAIGPSLQTIPKEVRKTLLYDCNKVDLLHAHLSIASFLFCADELFPLLEEGNIWNNLSQNSGLDKEIIKSMLYACLYSNSYDANEFKSIKDHTRNELKRFLSIPEISYFFRCRKEFMTDSFYGIEEDAFGNELQGTATQKLSALIQSYELKLLQPGIEYLTSLKNEKIRIVLWLHDGFYYTCGLREKDRINKKMMKLVNERCNSLKIPSRLIVE